LLWLFLKWYFVFLPRLTYTTILDLCLPCSWDDRHTPSHPAFIAWDGVLWIFCQGWSILPISPSCICKDYMPG
jgi:hypothetical protein